MGPVRIKICGVTQPADAEAAARLGVDFIGLNFYPKSPRCVTVERAGEIIAAAPELKHVAVMVHPTEEELDRLSGLKLFALQLYDAVSLLTSKALSRAGLPLILACGVAEEMDLRELNFIAQRFRDHGHDAGRLLLDAKAAGQHGGTGRTAPWQGIQAWMAAAADDPGKLAGKLIGSAARLPKQPAILLAGGMTPENVAEAIRIVQPWGVDSASGLESVPGVKDAEKMKRFVEAARGDSSS